MFQGKVTLLLSSSLICIATLHYVSGDMDDGSDSCDDIANDTNSTMDPCYNSSSVMTTPLTPTTSASVVSNMVTASMTHTISSVFNGENSTSSSSRSPNTSTTVSTTGSIDVMATSLATSSTPVEDGLPVLELIEENWVALVIGLGVGLLVGCCGCCLPLLCLFCRKKREVYVLEDEKKKTHVRFQEKSSVRVEEIPLESAENGKDSSKESDGSGEGESDPADTKEESPSDVVVKATSDVTKETATNDKEEKRVDLSGQDSAHKKLSDDKPAASGDTTSSAVKDESPSSIKDETDKDRTHSTARDKTASADTEKAEDPHTKPTGVGGASLAKTASVSMDEKAKTTAEKSIIGSTPTEKAKDASNMSVAPTENVREEKGSHTPTPENGSKQRPDTSTKQGNASSGEGAASGVAQSEKAAKLEPQPKQSKTIPGGDEIDALLKDVLNWEIHT